MIGNVQKETEMKISDIPEVVKKRPLRQRSLYTSHSFHGSTAIDDVKNDLKNVDAPPSDHWTIPTIAQSSTSLASIDNWRARPRAIRAASQTPILTSFFPTDDPTAYTETFGDSYGESYPDSYGDCVKEGTQQTTAVATPHGTMSMRLRDHVRVDMTVDQAVRVINFKTNIVMAMNATGGSVALLHPNGRVYQYGSRVEILAHDADGNEKYAKMWYKGVSFTSEQCALVYLVDAAGTRTTTDTFSDMTKDFSLPLFYEESRHGPSFVTEAIDLLKRANYWMTEDGVDNWIVNGVRISQTTDGLVRVARQSNKYQMRTSPSNGTASLTTPFMHCTASMGNTSHLFVRRGERRMHFDGTSFIVRNAGHSAGFDEKNQLKVY